MEKLFLLQESNAFNLSVGGKEFEESSLIVVLYSQSIQCCTKKKVKKKNNVLVSILPSTRNFVTLFKLILGALCH
jgi:hypothetical protein